MASTEDLFGAIDAEDLDRLKSLLASDPALAVARDSYGVSALMRARYHDDKALAQAILPHVPELDVFEGRRSGTSTGSRRF